jgi:hypothetical protein
MYIQFTQILDALQACRPFYIDLFQTAMNIYHNEWFDMLKFTYNNEYEHMDVNMTVISSQAAFYISQSS